MDQQPAFRVQQADSSSLPPFPSSPLALSVQQYALQGPPPHYPVPPPPSSPAANADTEDLVVAREPWSPAMDALDALDALSDTSISDDGFGQDGGEGSTAMWHDTPQTSEAELADSFQDRVCQADTNR